jgi:hypothetical protein
MRPARWISRSLEAMRDRRREAAARAEARSSMTGRSNGSVASR